jgi:hypothetical protein
MKGNDDAPMIDPRDLFTADFLIAIRALVNIHHSIYPAIPPQGIYFESLVEEAFKKIKKPFTVFEGTVRNTPAHDLLVEAARLSIKTETGANTHPDKITITKLCTSEKEPWEASVLVERALTHLAKYDHILMLRAIWRAPGIHYQLLDIPLTILRQITAIALQPVGKRKGRRSLGADIKHEGELLFHVHFDGADGKCQIRNLSVRHCVMLAEWDLRV